MSFASLLSPHRASRFGIHFCVLVMLAFSAGSPQPSAGGLKGRIRGTARDLNGKPVAGLLVRLIESGKGLANVTNTDDKGIYAFEELQAGNYDVEMSGSGYQRQIKKEIRVQPPFRNIVDFTLPPGPMGASSPVVYLPPAGEAPLQEVTGLFMDKERRPIADVALSLLNPANGAWFRGQSDREGRIRILGVPAGVYRALISSPGYVTVDLREAEVKAGSGLNLKLSLVEYPLNFKGRPEDLTPEEKPVPPDYRPPVS